MRGGTAIASAWIGEGATSESDFHAALVFASTYQAPVILNIVNNHWAISTPEDFARGASATFADRGFGFSIPALRVDGNDYLAVYAVSQWAAERARANLGPTMIEWVTLRVGCALHLRRPVGVPPADDGDGVPARRPDRPAACSHLIAIGEWDDDRHAGARRDEVDDEVADGVRRGRLARLGEGRRDVSSPATMFDDVYATHAAAPPASSATRWSD